MIPKESGFNQSKTSCALCARTHIVTFSNFNARLPLQWIVKFYKGCLQQPNCPERQHVDATIMRSFQTVLFSRFLPAAYSGNVNLATTKPWQFMPKYRDVDTVEFNIVHV